MGVENHPIINAIAGPAAQLSGSLLWVPMDVVKERMQIQRNITHTINSSNSHTTSSSTSTHSHTLPASSSSSSSASSSRSSPSTHGSVHFASSLDAVKVILRVEGIRGFYRGYIAHQIVWAPFNSAYFIFYDLAKNQLVPFVQRMNASSSSSSSPSSSVPFYVYPVCGGIGGGIAAALTAPLDLIKTRLQTQGNSGAYKGVFDCVKKICQKEGVSTLFRGTVARVMWLSPNVAITMSFYEVAKSYFHINPI